ncbi:TP901 family phage tail tape measure protein,Phage-related protein,phage tail tape measure protein, TP901 family, core region [[Clostridium] sordellii]|nr:TP901 family phage tail tape measure protein,Phage-related protein,phage tail tape measure protein, TP901 family, core region [[Clostridium] sordellii] [Paeniclostridium sordellii]
MDISLYDSTGKQRDMVDVLKEMAKKLGVASDGTSDLTEQQKQQYAAMVGGKTQFDTLMKLLAGVSAEYDTLEDQLKNSNGALAEMAKTMKDNLGGAIDNMKSALEGALIDAFKAMEPAIKSVVEKITDLSNWFNNLDEVSQEMIVTLAGVAAATGPLLIVTGKLISAGGNVVTLFGKLSKSGGNTAKVIGLLKDGFSLLGGPLGIGAAVAAVGLAIYAFKKFDNHMKKDVIPSTESVVDGMKNVSEETKKTIKPFIEMSQTVETEFIKIKSNGTTMTEGLKNGVVSKLDEMVKEVKTKLETNRDNAEKTFNEMFANAVTITDQEKKQIINASKEAFNKKIEDVQASKDKINEILQTALNENRELNKAEEIEIQNHYNNIKNTGLEIMSKSAEELKAIKKELNIHSKELSAQQASDVIQEAEKQRKGSIEKAQNEYQKRLKYAEMLRSKGSAENEQLATKVISEANRMKEEQITAANKTADSVINSAKVQAGEYSKYIDSMTGKVLSGWEVMGNSVDNFVLKMWYGLIDFFNNIPENVQIFFGKIGISLAEFGISAIDWWRSLPFTDDKALEGVRQSWVQSIDETSKYVKDKTSEMDLEKPFRELPGKVRNSLENNRQVLEQHFKMPLEKMVGDAGVLLSLTSDEFYKLPPKVQEALRSMDRSLQESGEFGLSTYLNKTKMLKDGVVFEYDSLDQNVKKSMQAVNNSIMDLNGLDLSAFVIQCQTAADGGKSAFEGLPPGVQNALLELDKLLLEKHKLSLGQFIINASTAKGEYLGEMEQIKTGTSEKMNQVNKDLTEKTKAGATNAVQSVKGAKTEISKDMSETKTSVENSSKGIKSSLENDTKQGGDAAATNLENTNKKVSDSSKNMENNVKGSMSGVNKNMQQEATNIYKGVSTSFYMMEKKTKQSATDMMKGVNTSTHNMSQRSREDASRMHNGVRDSANAMSLKARQSASEMYRGVTTSTRLMANAAIADWNRIRSVYSQPIHGTVTKTTVLQTISKGPKSITRDIPTISGPYKIPSEANLKLRSVNLANFAMPKIDTSQYLTRGSYYNSNSYNSSLSNVVNNSSNKNLESKLDKLISLMSDLLYQKEDESNKNVSAELRITDETGRYLAEIIAPHGSIIDDYKIDRDPRF